MRSIAVVAAACAAWTLAGGVLPPAPHVTIDRGRMHELPVALAAGVIGFAASFGLSGDPVIGLAVGFLAAAIPPVVVGSRRRARAQRTADRWPDFLGIMQGHLAGGATVPEATIAAGRQVSSEFAVLSNQLAEAMAVGQPFAEALNEARRTWEDPLADRVLMTLAAAAATGGRNVASTLGALAASVSDELRLRHTHEASLTQQRLTASVALFAPWVLLILTTSTNPQAAAALARPTGRLIVLGGLAATSLGYVLARRTARLSEPPRVFR